MDSVNPSVQVSYFAYKDLETVRQFTKSKWQLPKRR
jgi:hypothetical protein